MLSGEEREAYLQLLGRGASPAGACQQLGVSVAAVNRTLAADGAFARRVAEVDELLSRNVAAALYRAAMEGDVSAQKFWLDRSPPSAWVKNEGQGLPLDELLEGLSGEELVELGRSLAAPLRVGGAVEDPDAADGGVAGGFS